MIISRVLVALFGSLGVIAVLEDPPLLFCMNPGILLSEDDLEPCYRLATTWPKSILYTKEQFT